MPLYLRAASQSLRNLERRTLRTLRRALPGLAERDRLLGEAVLAQAPEISARLGAIVNIREAGTRTRYHLHLGQVLNTSRTS